MKTSLHIVALIAFAFGVSGCASTRAYVSDRGHDAADILTLTVGHGLGGAKVQAGPIAIGAYQNMDWMGLRGGEAFAFPDSHHAGWDAWFPFPVIPLDWGNMAGVEMWDGGMRSFERGKNIGYLSPYPFWIGGLAERGWRSPYPYQIDAAVGLGITIRAGVNPAEFVDFLLGWIGFDIFNDDLASRRLKEESNRVAGSD